MLTVST